MPQADKPNDALTCVFRWRLDQEVIIESLRLTGRILSRCDHGNGIHTYRVVYWSNGSRYDEWLHEFELRGK